MKRLLKTEKEQIKACVATVIDKYRNNEKDLQLLVIDGINSIRSANATAEKYKSNNKNFFKRAFNEITGKNAKTVSNMFNDVAKSQYALVEMVNQMNQDNLVTIKMIKSVNNRLNALQAENDEEFEEIYGVIYDNVKKIQNVLEMHSREIKKTRKIAMI